MTYITGGKDLLTLIFYLWISLPIILTYVGYDKIENPIYISFISLIHLILWVYFFLNLSD